MLFNRGTCCEQKHRSHPWRAELVWGSCWQPPHGLKGSETSPPGLGTANHAPVLPYGLNRRGTSHLALLQILLQHASRIRMKSLLISQSQISLSDSSRRTREPTTLKDSKKKKLVPKQLAALSFICKCPRSDTVPDFWRTGHMSQIIQLISKHLQGYRLSILTNLS